VSDVVDLSPVGPDSAGGEPEPSPAARLLLDAFDRIASEVEEVLDGLGDDQLAARPSPTTNSIAWLIWHLTRIQDDHLAAAFGHEQVWTTEGWSERFALPFDAGDTGYGHSPDQVESVRADGTLLRDYHRAVHDRSRRSLRGVTDPEWERVVDESWNPPVTLAVRMVSVVADDLEHAGQAAYVRGLLAKGDHPS